MVPKESVEDQVLNFTRNSWQDKVLASLLVVVCLTMGGAGFSCLGRTHAMQEQVKVIAEHNYTHQ